MKMRGILLAVLTTIFFSATSRASITGAWWWDDGDGALVCSATNYNANTGVLSMSGDQYWGPGHMNGWVSTSDPQDPRLTLGSAILNDTNFPWGDYHVNVYMLSNTFTIVNSGSFAPSVDNPPFSDWSVSSVVEPSSELVSGPYAGYYEGTVNLLGGTPVGIGGELDFNYTIQFSGASHFAFTQEVIPSTVVPEPGTLALVALSGLLLGWGTLARRRQ